MVGSSRFPSPDSFFSEVEWMIINEVVVVRSCSSRTFNGKSKSKTIPCFGILFSIGSTLSVMSVYMKIADFCHNFLVFFLINFLYGFWEWLQTIIRNWIHWLKFFSPFSLLRKENWYFPKTEQIGWQSSFCERNTVSCSTNSCTGLPWLSWVGVANWRCEALVYIFFDQVAVLLW